MLTLWDLLPRKARERFGMIEAKPPVRPAAQRQERPPTEPTRAISGETSGRHGPARVRGSMQDRYDEMTREMLARYGLRVRRWRTSMSGIAWQITYRDGSGSRLIESPRPKGPRSAAIFLHEVGHHAIGFNVYKPRCLEEYHAWAWAVAEMERRGLNVTDAVRKRMAESLRYAVDKARRRGLREVPPELRPFERR